MFFCILFLFHFSGTKKLTHMKKYLLSSVILFSIFSGLSAQISKGSVLLGGDLSASTAKQKSGVNESNNSGFSVSPLIGKAIKENFIVHCDSSLMAEDMYNMHKHDMNSFIRKTTHWHRLASYGLEKDLEYCVTPDVANVLPQYMDGALVIFKS